MANPYNILRQIANLPQRRGFRLPSFSPQQTVNCQLSTVIKDFSDSAFLGMTAVLRKRLLPFGRDPTVVDMASAAVCRGQPYPSAIGIEVGAIDGTGARVLSLLRLVLSTGNIICLAVCVCREICVFLQE